MISRRTLMLGSGAMALGGCQMAQAPYDGPKVTRVVVMKERRRLYLLNDQTIPKKYDVDLGFAPVGHKQVEGDGKTPEGRYFIDRRNPNSKFHLSLGISYPNAADVSRAAAMGASPGGDIFIHGQPNTKRPDRPDWSAGCIAVQNAEIQEIYRMVDLGTVIDIFP